MGIHPLALTRGVNREQIDQAVEHAAATIAIGNGPTMVLIIGPDDAGQMVEAAGVIRDEDVFFVHAAPMRPAYQPLLDAALAQPGAGSNGIPEGETDNGWSVDGLALTDELVADLKARAEKGHDTDVLRIRLRTGRPAPLAVGDVIRLDLPAPVYAACAEQADAHGLAIPELIRNTLRARL
ncbi:MAG: hypothetical protein JWM76_354 [Pseudonocardiales bacterium]|nr:hypothetical protein [Pseudonocardiales bacterium]